MTYLLIIILLIALVVLFFRLKRTSASIKAITYFLKEASSGNLDAGLFLQHNGLLKNLAMEIASFIEKTKKRLDFAETEMQRTNAILRCMVDGVLITDIKGNVVLANRTFSELISANEEIEGKPLIEVLRNAQLIDIFKKALDSNSVVSNEITLSKTNMDMHLFATATPVYSRDSVTGVVVTLHDITRIKQLEQIRKDFVANVSHEIKTPITAIKGFAETLLDGAINDRENALRFLGMIKAHSERLNSLVDDLLTLSRIELGDIKIKKAAINIEQVVDTVFMTLKEKADRKGLYLKKAIPDNVNAIYADKDRLIQIILNLVDNGIKFTEKGGVTVGIDETDERFTLYVQDTGIGIPQNHLHRLGERFYRVDRARSRELGGTGLGLAIVKHLINAHGWNMKIESELGQRTRVNIIIDKDRVASPKNLNEIIGL